MAAPGVGGEKGTVEAGPRIRALGSDRIPHRPPAVREIRDLPGLSVVNPLAQARAIPPPAELPRMDIQTANEPMVDLTQVQRTARSLQESIAKVIVGKGPAVELLLVALLTPGHVLIEDIPGIGKTTLAKSLACSLGCRFQRIQFTPDLLPSDITGVSVFNQKVAEFEFRAGPIMAQIVLADEINRAGPRTQSALLEAMEERQVTVDGVTYRLPQPF